MRILQRKLVGDIKFDIAKNLFAEILMEKIKNSGPFWFSPSKTLWSGDIPVESIPSNPFPQLALPILVFLLTLA